MLALHNKICHINYKCMSSTMFPSSSDHCLAPILIESTTIHTVIKRFKSYVKKNKIIYMHMFIIELYKCMIAIYSFVAALRLALSIHITSSSCSCRSNLNGKINIISTYFTYNLTLVNFLAYHTGS